jgi:hypothetical protein
VVRELVFRLLSVGGGTLGLLHAVQSYDATPVACDPARDCFAKNLTPNVVPILLWTGFGAIAGALVAVALIRLARNAR